MINSNKVFYIIQWIELIASIPLFFASIMFIFEKKRKSLLPIGFLLFTVATKFSTGHFFLITECSQKNISDDFFLSPESTFPSFLSIGASFGILFWSVIVCIFEFKARMILARRKHQKHDIIDATTNPPT